VIPDFQQFMAIDWSGARGPRLPGLQVAVCRPGTKAPVLMRSPVDGGWTRSVLRDELLRAAREHGPVLAGFDMSVAFPFCDTGCYFPECDDSPPGVRALWRLVDETSRDAPDFYARPFTEPGQRFAEFFNAPGHRGTRYDLTRLRVTDQHCLRWTRPSSVFNGVGPGSVGTGSLAGMRFFHAMKQQREVRLAIWPFDQIRGDEKLILCEIFPRFYVKRCGMDPRRWREPGFPHEVMRAFASAPVPRRNYTEDELDALYSAAAMRWLAGQPGIWKPSTMTRRAARYEGWIFGVT
jgi:hypothetical protein